MKEKIATCTLWKEWAMIIWKRSCSLVIIKKIQFKTTTIYHLKSIRSDINKTSHKCGWRHVEKGHSCSVVRNINRLSLSWKTFIAIWASIPTNIYLPKKDVYHVFIEWLYNSGSYISVLIHVCYSEEQYWFFLKKIKTGVA